MLDVFKVKDAQLLNNLFLVSDVMGTVHLTLERLLEI
jgi:hypothetical protein